MLPVYKYMKKLSFTFAIFLLLLIIEPCNLHAIIFLKRSGPYIAGTASWDWYLTNDVGLHVSTAVPEFRRSKRYRPKSGVNGNAILGYYLDQWRFELEAIFRQKKRNHHFTHGGFSVTDFGLVPKYAAMFNVYYDIPPCVPWLGFYLGVGVGCGFRDVVVKNNTQISRHTGAFAYQIMTGVYYDFACYWTVIFGYRLFGITPPQNVEFIRGNSDVLVRVKRSPLAQSLEAGLRYSF